MRVLDGPFGRAEECNPGQWHVELPEQEHGARHWYLGIINVAGLEESHRVDRSVGHDLQFWRIAGPPQLANAGMFWFQKEAERPLQHFQLAGLTDTQAQGLAGLIARGLVSGPLVMSMHLIMFNGKPYTFPKLFEHLVTLGAHLANLGGEPCLEHGFLGGPASAICPTCMAAARTVRRRSGG